MIPARLGSTVRALWPLFEKAGRREKMDGRLLLAFAWQQSGLDSEASDDTGGRGLFLMGSEVAEKVAKRRAARAWDLADPQTAVDFAACQLARCIERFGLPRVGVAACLSSADAVAAVGGNVPREAALQRRVRDVMVTWAWLIRNLAELLEETVTRMPVPSVSTVACDGGRVSLVAGAAASCCQGASAGASSAGASVGASSAEASVGACSAGPSVGAPTCGAGPSVGAASRDGAWSVTTSSGGACVLDSRLRLLHGDGDARWIDAGLVAEYECTAARLGLMFARDDDERTVYLGMPGLPPQRSSRLIVPVPGAGAASNGAYVGAEALDLLVAVGSPVVAVGSGTIVRTDTADAVVLQLDTPFVHHGRACPYASCAGLGRVRYAVEGGIGPHVVQGEVLGWSGVTGRMPCVRFALWGDLHGRPFLSPYAIAGYFGWIAEGA